MKSMKIAAFILTALLLPSGLLAQEQSNSPMSDMKQEQRKLGGNIMDSCQAMMASRQQMMSDPKALDAHLDRMVATMNLAKGNAKVGAMAAVINELVSQRKQVRKKLMAKQAPMMNQMMEHMGMGTQEMQESMPGCPMMKGGQSDTSKPHRGKQPRPCSPSQR